jgi:DNA-binding NtrC family response regulator
VARVLIVDDDPDIVEALVMGLEGRHDVVTAPHGKDALDRMAEQAADVVVLDLMMPVLDGEGYMAEHRVRHPEVPVIVVSAGRDVADTARRIGAVEWIAKPFRLDVLERGLERVLGARAS